jgi:peptide/nickel transport system permease protein
MQTMTTVVDPQAARYEGPRKLSPGLWTLAWRRLRADRVAMASLAIVAAFLMLILLSASGVIASDWSRETGVNYAPPSFMGPDRAASVLTVAPPPPPAQSEATLASSYRSAIVDPLAADLAALRAQDGMQDGADADAPDGPPQDATVDPLAGVIAEIRAGMAAQQTPVAQERSATLPFGGDKWGRDVLKKTIKGSETSILVGIAAALVATFLGTLFGAIAGYYGRWVDDFFNWFYSVFSSIPYLLLILAVAAVLKQKGLMTIVLILGLTGWTGVFRQTRAEYIRHKSREYVQAADAIGASHLRRMFVHVFPNVSHVALVQLSILVVAFIKSEVILSFLGFGVPVDVVSWGSMLNEAQNELILGKWWQLAAATAAMATLVTAFSLLTDALRDALDPRLKGLKA